MKIVPSNFNGSLAIYPPKQVKPQESEIRCSAKSTRPLNLKNTDNKLVSAFVNHPLSRSLSRNASRSQNGFIPGKDFVSNVLLVDAYSRALALACSQLTGACMVALDLVTAFPLLAHSFLFAAQTRFPSIANEGQVQISQHLIWAAVDKLPSVSIMI